MKNCILLFFILALFSCEKHGEQQPLPQSSIMLSPEEGIIGEKIMLILKEDTLASLESIKLKFDTVEIQLLPSSRVNNKTLEYTVPTLPVGRVNVSFENGDKKVVSAAFSVVNRTNWVRKQKLEQGRYGATSFSISSKGYVGLGSDYRFESLMNNGGFTFYYNFINSYPDWQTTGSNKSDFWEYDPTVDSWTQLPDFPGGKRYGAVGFSLNGKGYVGMGHDQETYFKDFWEYDPQSKTWTQLPDYPGEPRSTTSHFTINGKGYVALGVVNTPALGLDTELWEFETRIKSWTRKKDFPGSSTRGAVGLSIGEFGYIYTAESELWQYNPLQDTWTKKANHPEQAGRRGATHFSVGGKGFIGMGGDYVTVIVPSFNKAYSQPGLWQYNPDSDKWLKVEGGYWGENAFAFTIGDKAFVGAGVFFNRNGNHRFGLELLTDFFELTVK